MKFEMFSRVALATDIPESRLKRGDVARIVDYFAPKPDRVAGYILEVFNALGESIDVVSVPETSIESLQEDEILTIRHMQVA